MDSQNQFSYKGKKYKLDLEQLDSSVQQLLSPEVKSAKLSVDSHSKLGGSMKGGSLLVPNFNSKEFNKGFQIYTQPKAFSQVSGLNKQVNSRVHLCYLFASPLVYQTSQMHNYDILTPIGFQAELKQIKDAFQTIPKQINYLYLQATDSNFKDGLNGNPIGLHFSGHGFKNTSKSFQGDWDSYKKNQKQGDFLLFEQKNGASYNMYQKNLKQILELYNKGSNLKFVVIASCHSQECGQIFREAGVEHVICINKEQQIEDVAAIEFSRIFYGAVFNAQISICKAFASAKETLQSKFSKEIADKYELLVNTNHICDSNPISEQICLGQFTRINKIHSLVKKIPAKEPLLIGRNLDMFEILKLLMDSSTQIVQLFSMPGLGASSILVNLTNYIAERDLFPDGIIYLNSHATLSLEKMIEQLNFYLKEGKKAETAMYRDYQIKNYDLAELIQQFCATVREKQKRKMLIVLDNVNSIVEKNQGEALVDFFNLIVREFNKVSVLFGSSFYQRKIKNYKVKVLKGLHKKDAAKLFVEKIPNQLDTIDYNQIKELHEYTCELFENNQLELINAQANTNPLQQNLQPKLCSIKTASHVHSKQCAVAYLEQHPLIDMLGGYPHSISIFAPMLVEVTFKQAFQKMIQDQKQMNLQNNEFPLITSLEFTLKVLTTEKTKGAEIFYLIGITKNGLLYDDLVEIYNASEDCKETVDQCLKRLKDLSLVQIFKDETGGTTMLKVPIFIRQYIQAKLTIESKEQLAIMLATFYNIKIKNVMPLFRTHLNFQIVDDFLQQYESNIQSCLEIFKRINDKEAGKNSDQEEEKKVQGNELEVAENLELPEISIKSKSRKSFKSKRSEFNIEAGSGKMKRKSPTKKSIKEGTGSSSGFQDFLPSRERNYTQLQTYEITVTNENDKQKNNNAERAELDLILNTLGNEEDEPQDREKHFERLFSNSVVKDEDVENDIKKDQVKNRMSIESLKRLNKEHLNSDTFNIFMNKFLPNKTRRQSVQTPTSSAFNPLKYDKSSTIMRMQSLHHKLQVLQEEDQQEEISESYINLVEAEILLLNYCLLLALSTSRKSNEVHELWENYESSFNFNLLKANIFKIFTFVEMNSKQKDLEKAQEYCIKSHDIFMKLKCVRGHAITLLMRAKICQLMLEDDLAHKLGEEALSYFNEIDDFYGIQMCYNILYNKQINITQDQMKNYFNIFDDKRKMIYNLLLTSIEEVKEVEDSSDDEFDQIDEVDEEMNEFTEASRKNQVYVKRGSIQQQS